MVSSETLSAVGLEARPALSKVRGPSGLRMGGSHMPLAATTSFANERIWSSLAEVPSTSTWIVRPRGYPRPFSREARTWSQVS